MGHAGTHRRDAKYIFETTPKIGVPPWEHLLSHTFPPIFGPVLILRSRSVVQSKSYGPQTKSPSSPHAAWDLQRGEACNTH